MPQTQSQYITLVRVAGRDMGQYQTWSGGNETSENIPDRYPGAKFPTASGGERSIEPVTVGRRVRKERDNEDYFAWLRRFNGVENALTAVRKPTDADGNPYGKGETYTATITGIGKPDSDTNSNGQAAETTITFQPSNVS